MKKLIIVALLIIFILKIHSLTNTEYNENSQIKPNIQTPIQTNTVAKKFTPIEHKTQTTRQKQRPHPKPKPIKKIKKIKYKCDGRKHCSQMRSYEEAKYFLSHCRGVKMDGDRDGIPCERQFRRY